MQPIISMSMWTSLTNEERNRIRTVFSIPRSRNVEVHDGQIVTDGTTPDDFKALSIEKMQLYVEDGSTDFHKLFGGVIEKVRRELSPPISVSGTNSIPFDRILPSEIMPDAGIINAEVNKLSEPKKRGRPSKKNADAKNK